MTEDPRSLKVDLTAEQIERLIEKLIEVTPRIVTTINNDGIVTIHEPGCHLIHQQQPYSGPLPEPDKIQECDCMPTLTEIYQSMTS